MLAIGKYGWIQDLGHDFLAMAMLHWQSDFSPGKRIMQGG